MTAVADKFLHDDALVRRHFEDLRKAVFDTYDLRDIARYLVDKTMLAGQKFSFKDHEFQLDILSDVNQDVYVQKCAQVGLSEAMARYALGATRIMPFFSTILTMPYQDDAKNFAKTRLDPIIDQSPDLRGAVNSALDNSGIKQIGNSLLYMRGTHGSTQAISVPADMVIHDEVDRSDPATLGQYQSRLKHSRWKLTRMFGTPTADRIGIAKVMEASKRHRHMVKCLRCNHHFVPSYHDDVVIPGFGGEKNTITKYTLPNLRWKEAYLNCPGCKREITMENLGPAHRQWVVENPLDNFTAHGYFVIPFSVPKIVSVASLVKESTRYASWTEFVNQALGETDNNSEESLTESDLMGCITEASLDSTAVHMMGIDVGQTCHLLVGRLDHNTGTLLVVHRQRCAIGDLTKTYNTLRSRYRVIMTVMDSMPETYLVQEMQKRDKNLYGAIYHHDRAQARYQIKRIEEDPRAGKLKIHQARIHKDLNFDEIMNMFKHGQVRWYRGDADDSGLFVSHCLDMTRKKDYDRADGVQYVWAKSETADDHYFHTLGYLHVACRLVGTAQGTLSSSVQVPMSRTIKMPSMKEVLQFGR